MNRCQNNHLAVLHALALIVIPFLLLAHGCAGIKPSGHTPGHTEPYKVNGKWYRPLPHGENFKQRGTASWYGKPYHGKKTANGEIYNMYGMSAAHKTLPLGTYIRVTNLDNKRKIEVRINDRGPFVRGRIIDLSYTAAKKLGIVGPGTARVEIAALGVAEPSGSREASRRSYTPVDANKGNFTFQIGAFRDRKNAEQQRKTLSRKYDEAHISVFNSGHGVFYRVRVGRFSDLAEAQKQKAALKRDGHDNVMIVAE